MTKMSSGNSFAEHLSISLREEFEILVKQNMKRAYYVALGFLGSHDEAMEASQTAFVKAYRNFNKFDRSKKFFTWYYKILKNTCLNAIRDKKARGEVKFLEFSGEEFSEEDIEKKLEKDELESMLEDALLKLDEDDRELIILREFENYSYREIAELLEIPIGTVMSKLYYARKKLFEKLKKIL